MSTPTQSPVPVKKPFFRRDPITTTLAVLAIFFVSQIAAGLLISGYPSFKNWSAEEGTVWLETSVYAQFFYVLLAEVFTIWLVFGLLKRVRATRHKIGLIKPALIDIVYALSAYVVYFIGYIAIITVATNLTDVLDVEQKQQIGFEAAVGGDLWLVFVGLVLLAPLAEEILFRGFLFTSFRQKYRFYVSAVSTSVLFGIAHLQFGSGAPLLWVAAIDTFILSMVLCYIREKTGSLWPSIILHAIKNCIAFIALFHARF